MFQKWYNKNKKDAGYVNFGFRVTPHSESAYIVREAKQLIQHRKHIGREM